MSVINLSDLVPKNYLTGEVGQIIDDNGTLKVQPLSFIEENPSSNGNPEEFVLKSFNITGNEPSYNSNNAMDFYKCASVNTVNSNWTGYKAVLSEGVYRYESSVTSELIYTSVTPVVGSVYADGAIVQAILYEGWQPPTGAVFYAPLSASSATAETGQSLMLSGSLSYEVYKGVPSALFNGQSYITVTDLTDINSCQTNNAITLSFWMCGNGNYSYYDGIFTAQNGAAPNNWQWACFYQGNADTFTMYLNGTNQDVDYPVTADTWYHFCMVGGNGTWKFYVNGSQINSGTCNAIQSISNAVMIGWWDSSYGKFNGRLSACRIYNRALSAAEVAVLSAEFTPTQS